jgi:hypothetical protein
MTSAEMDAIFNGAATVISTTQNVCNSVASGINDIKGALDNSRRNQVMPNMQMNVCTQPVTYGYGYADTVNNNNFGNSLSIYNNPLQPTTPTGYVGFTNPAYGMNSSGMFTTNSVVAPGGAWG